MREKDHIVDIGVDKKIILKWIFKKSVRGVEWIDLALDRDGTRSQTLGYHKKCGISLLAAVTTSFSWTPLHRVK